MLSSIRSPDRTIASGPPAAASGATCNITVPKLVPLIRPSLIRTISVTPASLSFFGIGIIPHSGMPGTPFGPAFFSTTGLLGSILTRLQYGYTIHHASSVVSLFSLGNGLVVCRVKCCEYQGYATQGLRPRKACPPLDCQC